MLNDNFPIMPHQSTMSGKLIGLKSISNNTLKNKLARKKIIKKVVELSGVEESKINNLLDKYGSYSYASLIIKENLDYETALKIYIASGELPGIFIQKGSKRKYPIVFRC